MTSITPGGMFFFTGLVTFYTLSLEPNTLMSHFSNHWYFAELCLEPVMG